MRALLRSLWNEPRAPDPPRRLRRDRVLVGVLAALALIEGALRPDLPERFLWVTVVVGLAAMLLWRRTRPLLMLVIAFSATTVIALLVTGGQPEMLTLAALLIFPYALYRWGSGREAVIGTVVMVVTTCLSLLTDDTGIADAVGGTAVLTSTLALGAAFRYGARARLRELDQVKLFERERLARDLHDTVAHHVSAIAIRAQAGLATAASRPGAAVDALRVIEAEASRTLAEMRAIVRVLRRDEPADLRPNPRITDLERLARRTRAGPTVDVELSGDLDDVPRRSGPRSTAWHRSRSPTPCGTPATPPASRSGSPPTTHRCACACATTATRSPPARPARPGTGSSA